MIEFFKDSEIIGLDIKLVVKLDMARKMAGIPFIITSGRRTPAKSVAVGGFATDAHTKGLAVDIYCKNDNQAFWIIKGAYVAGFRRIIRGNKHIHLDIDESLPQDIFFIEPAFCIDLVKNA